MTDEQIAHVARRDFAMAISQDRTPNIYIRVDAENCGIFVMTFGIFMVITNVFEEPT